MAPVTITLATEDYDRVRALKDGRVPIEGCAVEHLTLHPPEMFARLFTRHEFDVSEMSFSTYLVALAKGDFPYIALPVFPSRAFAHSSIYVRTDRAIVAPADLRGRTVGIPNYQFSRGLAVRGVLRDEYGLVAADMAWRIGGIDTPQDHDYLKLKAAPGIDLDHVPPGETLSGMLEAGTLDAVICAPTPGCFVRRAPHVGRLFAEFRGVERAYFAKTGIFPIMHLVGIRRSLVERHPWMAATIARAFAAAKALARPALFELDALAVQLPWLVAEAEETVALMGEDFWPYGVAANRAALDAGTRWSYELGLTPARFAVDELFERSTRDLPL